MIIKCVCCNRQIIHNQGSDIYIAPTPATVMGIGIYACKECSEDLDENGLFPEERAEVESLQSPN